MNKTLKIIAAKDPTKSISSNDEALHCLKIIQSNFSQTKNELHEIGLLGERINLKPTKEHLCLTA